LCPEIVVPKLGFSAARLLGYHVALNLGFRVVYFLGYFVASVPGSRRFLREQARSEQQLRSHRAHTATDYNVRRRKPQF